MVQLTVPIRIVTRQNWVGQLPQVLTRRLSLSRTSFTGWFTSSMTGRCSNGRSDLRFFRTFEHCFG